MLALGAAMAVPAAQAAEFGRCVAHAHGEYKDSACTKRSPESESGSYEWESYAAEVTGGGGGGFFTKGSAPVGCTHGESTGSFNGAGTGEMTLDLFGCHEGEEDEEDHCQTASYETPAEEIVTFPFETRLIGHGEKGPVGLEPRTGEVWLSSEGTPWFTKFYCARPGEEGAIYFEMDGSVSGRIKPVNAMATEHYFEVKPEIAEKGVGEQGLKTTICHDPAFSMCFVVNEHTRGTLVGTLFGEWEIRTEFTGPPTVRASAVGEITKASAVMNGSVDPNGSSVSECVFEYGTTVSYGKSAACSPAPGSGSKAVLVSASLSGLTEGTAYHYRLLAKNPGGPIYTADQTFATFVSSKSGTNKEESEPAKAEEGLVSATASKGLGTVTVGLYGENPGGVRLFGSAGEYVDVYVSTSSTFAKVEYEDCELGGGSTLEWFDPEASEGKGEWLVVTKQTYVAGSPDCIDAVAEVSGTSPTVAQMKGTRFKAAAAIAAPEFGRCVAAPLSGLGKPEGFFSKSSCTVKSEDPTTGVPVGKYEWELNVLEAQQGQAATHFTLAGSAAKLETAVKAFKVTCTGVSGEGEYTGPKALGGIVLKLTGCIQNKEACTSSGASAGEVKTKTLEGVLGWEAKPANKVALELFPHSGPFAEFSCAGTAISVRGGVLAPVKANKASATPALKFKGSKGVQKPEGFEGAPKAILEESSNGGLSYEAMDLSATITQTNTGGALAAVNTAF